METKAMSEHQVPLDSGLPGILRAVVVDDEEPARRLIREYMSEIPEAEIIAECANGLEAVRAVTEHDPDLLLLDIQMPKLDGFEVLELIERDLPVVFITAHDEHAVRAFEVHAVDYLLKPFSAQRLAQAIRRARERASALPPFDQLAREASACSATDRILVREGSEVHVIPASSVDHIDAHGDGVLIHAAGKVHEKLRPLGTIESRLDPERFLRIHRSHIINIDRLRKLELYAKNSYLAILADGTRLPVSRSGYARLRDRL
jgi:two-component system LytT family response regulator